MLKPTFLHPCNCYNTANSSETLYITIYCTVCRPTSCKLRAFCHVLINGSVSLGKKIISLTKWKLSPARISSLKYKNALAVDAQPA